MQLIFTATAVVFDVNVVMLEVAQSRSYATEVGPTQQNFDVDWHHKTAQPMFLWLPTLSKLRLIVTVTTASNVKHALEERKF